MDEYEIQKIINGTKELCDIRNEYQKTQKLLQEQRWDELKNHITEVIMKYPVEANIHNLRYRIMPNTIQQNAINCMCFLETLFRTKLGINVADITKYLME